MRSKARPGHGTLSTPARAIFEVLTLAALLIPIYWIASHWTTLPVLIPEHYNLAGISDRTGLRYHLWFAPAAAFVLYVLLGAISFLPQFFNLPVSHNHPQRVQMEHLGIELVLTLRLELVTVFGLLALAGMYSARTGREAFSFWFSLGAAAVTLGTAVLFVMEMFLVSRSPRSV